VETFGLVKVVVSSRFLKKRSFTLLKIKTQARLDFFSISYSYKFFFSQITYFLFPFFYSFIDAPQSGIMLLHDALSYHAQGCYLSFCISFTVCFSDA